MFGYRITSNTRVRRSSTINVLNAVRPIPNASLCMVARNVPCGRAAPQTGRPDQGRRKNLRRPGCVRPAAGAGRIEAGPSLGRSARAGTALISCARRQEATLTDSTSPSAEPPDGANGRKITVIQQELFKPGRSKAARYAQLVVGRPGIAALARYEAIVTLCSALPGALGLFLRSRLYPLLLGRAGRNVTFGSNVVLRHPHKIRIGDDVVIDDGCCLDAKGDGNRGIDIGTGVFIGRGTILSCKNGDIVIDDHANIGFNCEIFSGARVRLGKHTLVAAYTYLVGGDHTHDRTDTPVLHQKRVARGIEVDDNAWLGAHVVVADGVTIGRDAIVGAGAVVRREIPPFSVAAGVPARVIRDRRNERSARVNPRPAAGSADAHVRPL